MMKPLLAFGAFVMAVPAFAQVRCDRADLQTMADAYLAAQTSGDTLKMPLANFTQYTEQGEDATMLSGILSTPHKIDFHRTLFDLAACATFTELVIADPAHPYVMGTRLQFAGRDNPIAPSRLSEVESVITDGGDWLFDAANTLRFARAEDWAEIPAGQRDSRDTIVAAANAYLDWLDNKSVPVPWATPCARLEGGLYTGKGGGGAAGTEDRCDVDLPALGKAASRRYLVDESIGAVAVLLNAGADKRPDVHTFRVEKGHIRYVHAMTVCTAADCGVPVPDAIKRRVRN